MGGTICFVLVAILVSTIAAFQTLDVTSFGVRPDSGADATSAFQQAFAAVRLQSGPVKLHIPRGRYDFFPAHATKRAAYYSNATEAGSDAVRTIALNLNGIKNLEIVGDNASLVMRGKMTMLAAESCENLNIRGLTFDIQRPTVSEIEAVQKGDGFWVGRVTRDSLFQIDGHRVRWVGEGWSAFHNLVQHFDPATGTTWRGSDPTAKATAVESLGDRRIRFVVPPETLKEVAVGRIYQVRNTTRDESGFWFNRCRQVSIQDVKVVAMAGFGMLFQFTDGITLNHLEIEPDPKSDRTCASAADILHFSGCRGQIKVLNSKLSAAHDDAINVHGTQLRIVAKMGDRQVRLRFMHDQTWGFDAYQAKDEVDFVHRDTLLTYASAVVTKVERASDSREQIVTLDRPLPNDLKLDSDTLENTTWTPSVEVSGCEFSRIPTRGILVTTRRPVRIHDNSFLRIPMASVLIADDASSWFESGAVRDVKIERNRFVECSGPEIEVSPENSLMAGAVHRNILVQDNDFLRCGLPMVSARAVDGLGVIGNRFYASELRKLSADEWLRQSDSTRVRVKGNVIVMGELPKK
ncbi:right-handed parallel beta-helix repeat-containing protein [soil metagenome]